MEAMANGKPVVCSKIRGNVDLIDDGKGGFVVPNDAQCVADALRKLTENPALQKQMGEYNRHAVDQFREEVAVEENYRLIKSLLG